MVQNAFASLFNNPTQLQHVLAALQSQMPVSIPADPGAEAAQISRETAPTPSFNFRPPVDGQLSPTSTLSLLSAASSMGALSTVPSGDDMPSLGMLAQSGSQFQKTYKEAADVEADVNTLHGHIDSLIESLGLDASMTAALRGESDHLADGDIVSSTTTDAHRPLPPPQLSDVNPDVDFDAFLSHNFDKGVGMDLSGVGAFDAAAQQNGAEKFGAFLDEVRSVSNESDVTASSAVVDSERVELMDDAAKKSRKRKSDSIELWGEAQATKVPRMKKKR